MYKVEFCETNAILQRFFSAHGTHIQTLILQQSHPVTEKELYWALENYLPNLETLWLRYVPIPVRRPPSKIQPPIQMREYSFPTIKHLTVGTQSFVAREGMPPPVVPIVPGGDGQGGWGPVHEGDAGNGNGGGNPEEDANAPPIPPRDDEAAIRGSFVRLLSSLPNLQTISCSFLDNWCDCTVSLGILRALVQVPREIGRAHV